MSLVEKIDKGGVRRPTLEIQVQRLVERLPMPPSEGLEITGAAAAAQDPKHGHEQQKPLGVAHHPAVAAIRDGLEEADQIIGISLINCSIWGWGMEMSHSGGLPPLAEG